MTDSGSPDARGVLESVRKRYLNRDEHADLLLDALSDGRRRLVLAILAGREHPTTLDTLVAEAAAREIRRTEVRAADLRTR